MESSPGVREFEEDENDIVEVEIVAIHPGQTQTRTYHNTACLCRGTWAATRLAACVTVTPLQVTCTKLEDLHGELVGRQVMINPDDRELNNWAIK